MHRQKKRLPFKSSLKLTALVTGLFFLLTATLLLTACTTTSTSTSTSTSTTSVISSRPGDSSVQKLPDRSLGELHDYLQVIGKNCSPNDKSELTILNATSHSLKVELNGMNGVYSLLLEPRRDRTWLINAGTYHVEFNVPGFPPAAASALNLESSNKYKWKIIREQPLK
ncbi:hypothetical protein KAI46_12520 [bacterium]|nr:hypothetical protein [bacterium]